LFVLKKYLIIKIAAIGDVIMALPMLEKIRQENSNDVYITWVCGSSVYPLLKKFAIDELICLDEKSLLTGNKLEKIWTVLQLWRKIAFRKYDIIAIGHAARQYKILTILTRSKVERSFNHKKRPWPIPTRHHSDEYIRLVSENASKEICSSNRYLQIQSSDVLKKFFIERKECKGKIVFAPGGAKNLLADDDCRRWPIENYVKLAKCLIQAGYTVILSGGKNDIWVNAYFEHVLVDNWIGKTSLEDLLGIYSNSDLLITHDSGPLHLGGLTQIPIIALFGPTNPYEKIPRRENVKFIWNVEKYACCPCYDGKYYAACTDNICLRQIHPDQVFDEIATMLVH
jgi:heptosyltransferase-2